MQCWRVWGTPPNFNGFRVLPSLLQRRRSPEAKQTLHDVWPSPGLLGAEFTLRRSLAFAYIGSVTARHSSSGRQPNFAVLQRLGDAYGLMVVCDSLMSLA